VVTPEPDKPDPRGVITAKGSATHSDLVNGKRVRLWTVNWARASILFESEENFGGKMVEVTGTIFENDQPASTFKAAEAYANRASNTLKLTGGVSVKSVKDGSTLSGSEVIYFAEKSLIEASGNISLDAKTYTISGIPKILASSDFSEIATPDMYKGKNAKK
jgi:hypothetical protein